MKIGIIGRGSVAQALAKTFSPSHEVRLGVRSVVEGHEGPIGEIAKWAEVILLATPWGAEAEVCRDLAEHVAGKTLIDATNPVGMRKNMLDLVHEGTGSAAQSLQSRLPAAHVVKCFNQIGAEFMANPSRLADTPVMFAAGDDAEAKNVALILAKEAGFEAVDGGPLSNARHLESLAMIWIWSAIKGPLGRSFGFALVHAKNKEIP
ncbi:MAG: NAD(P)-binding domain-containing protein [Yoonia sp.]|uniref:NADPH-dependent F420 reductase n=1 Tax=Yoonia sp. TaxID=2212373 RepID=UPI00274013C9|nr:NAD(P)-binding domain-containing protein [Yoonia sp.]MDP5085911.1 NAD(P)-binding domain-containing protein [Yoonia sp.]MDP5361462.1 NAD(P)-binding domain-containing protein [Paracoccaceae bacterium]